MKYTLLFILCLLFLLPADAQVESDKVVFQAMQDEIQRNKEQLALPGMQSPFFISYGFGRYRQFEIVGVLGGITNSYVGPWSSVGSVQVLLGNYQHNSDASYVGQMAKAPMPDEIDYDVIRRGFWQGSDMMYKWSLQNAAAKEAFLKANPLTPEEAVLADQEKVEPVTKMIEAKEKYVVDQKALEALVSEVSAVFKNYKEIYNSMVVATGFGMDTYRQTTDGVSVKQPLNYVNFFAQAYVMTKDGVKINDSFSVLADRPEALPSAEELKKKAVDFAEHLMQLRDAEPVEEFYSGPVLFEGGACSSIFTGNLLNKAGLFASRKPAGNQNQGYKTLDDRIGRKIIDSRLTVKNYSTLEKYNGTPLLGAYQIDAEGVVPAKEMTLVDKGILKGMLNGSVPSLKTPHSTGSSRFMLTNDNLYYTTAPGTIHIQVEKGLKADKMKKALLKAAKEEGLDYAYIVRKIAGNASLIYRVNVKDGAEKLVRFADISPIGLSKIKRILEISAEENVSNYVLNSQVLSSLIYPSSILLEDVEIGKRQVKGEKAPVVTYPLQR